MRCWDPGHRGGFVRADQTRLVGGTRMRPASPPASPLHPNLPLPSRESRGHGLRSDLVRRSAIRVGGCRPHRLPVHLWNAPPNCKSHADAPIRSPAPTGKAGSTRAGRGTAGGAGPASRALAKGPSIVGGGALSAYGREARAGGGSSSRVGTKLLAGRASTTTTLGRPGDPPPRLNAYLMRNEARACGPLFRERHSPRALAPTGAARRWRHHVGACDAWHKAF